MAWQDNRIITGAFIIIHASENVVKIEEKIGFFQTTYDTPGRDFCKYVEAKRIGLDPEKKKGGLICPDCNVENSKNTKFCIICGKYLGKNIAYFKGEEGDYDIEVTPDALIMRKISSGSSGKKYENEVYEREKITNITIDINESLSHLCFYYRGEIKSYSIQKEYLDEVKKLFKYEIIEKKVNGWFDGKEGILVGTNKRVFFVNNKKWPHVTSASCDMTFLYENITNIKHAMTWLKNGLIKNAFIIIHASGNVVKIEEKIGFFQTTYDTTAGKDFCEYVEAKISCLSEHLEESSQTLQQISPLDEIKKARELLKIG